MSVSYTPRNSARAGGRAGRNGDRGRSGKREQNPAKSKEELDQELQDWKAGGDG